VSIAPACDRGTLVSREVQAKFRAPPQDIVGRASPFMATQIIEFSFKKAGRDFISEAIAPQQELNTGAVRSGIPVTQRIR